MGGGVTGQTLSPAARASVNSVRKNTANFLLGISKGPKTLLPKHKVTNRMQSFKMDTVSCGFCKNESKNYISSFLL